MALDAFDQAIADMQHEQLLRQIVGAGTPQPGGSRGISQQDMAGLSQLLAQPSQPQIRRLPPVDDSGWNTTPTQATIQADPTAWPSPNVPADVSNVEDAPNDLNSIIRPQYGMSGDSTGAMHPAMQGQMGGYDSGGNGGYGGGALHASDGEILMGLAASLLGGGGFQGYAGRASAVLGAQQASVEHNAQLAQAMHRASPAGGMQKQQRDIYESRMNGDVNRFIKAKSQDVNGSIPQEEWEQGWQQLRSQYSPLGLDPGPSPFEIQWEASRESSPEFRNASIAKQFKEEYGDTEANIVTGMLADGAKSKDVANYRLQLERQKIEAAKVLSKSAADESAAAKKQIEIYRKRDLEQYKNAGIGAGELSKNSALMVQASPSYSEGESAIHRYHDLQQQSISNGTLAHPSPFFGAPFSNTVTKKDFPALVSSMQVRLGHVGNTAETNGTPKGDALLFPATANPSGLSNLSPEQRARAINADDPTMAASALKTANDNGQAVLIRYKGQLRLLRPQTGL